MDTPGFCCRTETRSGAANTLQAGCDWTRFIATFLLISLALILALLLLQGQVLASLQ